MNREEIINDLKQVLQKNNVTFYKIVPNRGLIERIFNCRKFEIKIDYFLEEFDRIHRLDEFRVQTCFFKHAEFSDKDMKKFLSHFDRDIYHTLIGINDLSDYWWVGSAVNPSYYSQLEKFEEYERELCRLESDCECSECRGTGDLYSMESGVGGLVIGTCSDCEGSGYTCEDPVLPKEVLQPIKQGEAYVKIIDKALDIFVKE